jgi:hypothetical protein
MEDFLVKMQDFTALISEPQASTYDVCTTNDLLRVLGTMVVELSQTDKYKADDGGEKARVAGIYSILQRKVTW